MPIAYLDFGESIDDYDSSKTIPNANNYSFNLLKVGYMPTNNINN